MTVDLPRLLVVDDDPDLRELLCEYLGKRFRRGCRR